MNAQDVFKKGDYIIRKWSDDWGGETDVTVVDSVEGYSIISDKFFRIHTTGYVENMSGPGDFSTLMDSRCEFDWRKMTDEEKEHFTTLIPELK